MDSILQSEKECWKDIIGYKGVYQISNLGNVRTAERYVKQSNCCRKFKSILMSPTDNGNGYLIVGLRKNHNRKSFYNLSDAISARDKLIDKSIRGEII